MLDNTVKYAEVIVPLPLNTTFTYRVPTEMGSTVMPGCRVIVPFGKRKFYTAIVVGVSTIPPEGYDVKEIADVPDSGPILRYPQLKLWEWIAEYYLCSLGDVMRAALPAGLKIESETFVELNSDDEEPLDRRLSEREAIIVHTLDHHGKISVSEIERHTGLQRLEPLIATMVERGIISVAEKLVERYRSKKETCVRLVAQRDDNAALHATFDAVKGAPKQERMLVALIDMLNKQRTSGAPDSEVTREDLLNACGLSPSILTALINKGIVTTYVREINRFRYLGVGSGQLPTLSEPQSKALREIHTGFTEKNVILLHGVTASGKTELYIHLIDYTLNQGNQALFLVPEIALTTQLTLRLQRVFGDKVIIYHSKFTDNERVDLWKRVLHSSQPCVVIGARSALFLPFAKLGLIVVDEEHESSYKQADPAPRYNARDCAIVLASLHGAKTLLGSATPSIETHYKALTGHYGLVRLDRRYQGARLPAIEVVDMVQERRLKNYSPFSPRLISLTREQLSQGNQAIFFLNRRGYAPVVTCKLCAHVPKCLNCDVSLTYHRRAGEMVCHYCGSTYPLPTICPQCKEPAIEVHGFGTERVEDSVDATFARTKISRMDLDTTRNKDGYEQIITDFSSGKSQILVGTQMVTKGLDFGRVSVVGVLNADNLINIPDFRASERAFNMLEQVAGRAGRADDVSGTVVVQTTQPDHPVIGFLRSHDYHGFYDHELAERQRFNYPPFTRVINIYLKHRDLLTLIDASSRYATTLRELFGNRVFGPDEPHVARVQSLFIRKIMLKIEVQASMRKVKDILRGVYESFMSDPTLRALTVYYDVDPM